MRPLRFRTKLLLSHFGLVGVVLALVSVILERSLAADLEQQRYEHLVEQARGATEWVSSGRHPNRVAARLAAIVRADVTIFDSTGCVVGRSDAPDDEAEPAPTDCRAPPEVEEAKRSGVGRASRVVNSERFDFVAVPAEQALVLRVAVSTREIDAPISAMRARLILAGLLAAALALILALLAAQVAARPLRSMARQARRIARGDYTDGEPPVALARDEFGELAESLASLARQLQQDMDRIGRLEVTRRDFVANVTHELRTPIAAIQGCAETLLADLDPQQARRFIDLMHKHAQRLSGLVDGLLRLSEIEARAASSRSLAPVDVGAASMEIRQTLAARAAAHEVTVTIDVPEGTNVVADATSLEQVLENLVDNAIKYGRAKGTVTVRADREGERVRILVSDDGPGVAVEHLPRLFERFYRVDAGRSRQHGGAGLGLAIVKHLVEEMEGTIRVESELGAGTTFIVELRAAA